MRANLYLLALVFACGGLVSGAARAQVVDPTWQQTVSSLAQTLCAMDERAADAVLESIPLHNFGTDTIARPLALLAQTSGGRVISARAYAGVPTSSARDLAEDFAASDLPEPVRRRFIPADAEQLRHANALAAQWVSDSLRLTKRTPVAVLVLWRGEQSLPTLAVEDYKRHVVFVMVRGRIDQDGETHPEAIVFGNPLLAP